MFAFDHWAEWLQMQATEISRQGVDSVFKDGRTKPELASNPSVILEVSTGSRLGYIGLWQNGLCDYEVLDAFDGKPLASAAMVEANDDTVTSLFERFMSALS